MYAISGSLSLSIYIHMSLTHIYIYIYIFLSLYIYTYYLIESASLGLDQTTGPGLRSTGPGSRPRLVWGFVFEVLPTFFLFFIENLWIS